ncbi:MAG: ABC transporter permease subunit [Proteobacteria bacterium]|nr:ABC transporter permease subunit [Pseudomonadota bacterium]
MNNLIQATWVELFKARRSNMPLLTGIGFLLVPLVGGFFMIILKDPELARRAGLISTKAQLMAGVADWPTFLNLLAQATAVGGLILFSLIGSWVFGREYSDRTIKDLLALPISRSAIVAAKFVLIAAWSTVLVLIIYGVGLAVGAAVDLPQVPAQVIQQGSVTIAITAALTIASITPIIFFASAGHGYLPPMGVAILAIVFAQVVAIAGWGEYFPWSIPALYSQGVPLGAVSYVIMALTGIAGVAATFLWWELADQTH